MRESSSVIEERYGRSLQEHGRSLWRVAGSYEADLGRREDLYQDLCLALWQALPAFRAECSERTFVFRIAHNRGLSHAWKRRPAPAELDEAAEVPDPRPDPLAALDAEQRRERLQSAIRSLPLLARQVLTLSLEGLGHQEIAEVLGVTENNVAVRLSRARKALQEVLQGAGGKSR